MARKISTNIIVTGATGFIGANLVRQLVAKEKRVHVLLRPSSSPWRLKDIQDKLIFHQEQLTNRKGLTKLFNKIKPEIIYHLATYGSYPTQIDVDDMVRTNVSGTLNLLFASKDIDYQSFINIGSSSEYGIKFKPMREDDLCKPISFYAATKLSATHLCQVFAQIYQKPIVILRPFSVYGPFEEKSRFIPTIIHNLLAHHPVELTPGQTRHDFIYIDDVVVGLLRAPQKINEIRGKIINLGTGLEYTNDEVVRVLFQVSGKKVPIKKGTFAKRTWDTSHWRADVSLAKKLLGWEPKNSLEDGLKKTFDWFKNYETN